MRYAASRSSRLLNDGISPCSRLASASVPAAVRGLAVERRVLVRVLAVAQVLHLVEDDREVPRELVVRDLVQVRRDLRVVRGDRAERLRRELGPGLRAHDAELADLLDDLRVIRGVGDRGDTRRVPCGRAEERGAGHVDHLDRLLEPDDLDPDRRRERLHVDDHDVDEPDALGLELIDLLGLVAPREDPRVHRVVERLDLATDVGLALGQVRDRAPR
jgi:hypothetical protein